MLASNVCFDFCVRGLQFKCDATKPISNVDVVSETEPASTLPRCRVSEFYSLSITVYRNVLEVKRYFSTHSSSTSNELYCTRLC